MEKLSEDPAYQPQQWVENRFTEGSVQGTLSVKNWFKDHVDWCFFNGAWSDDSYRSNLGLVQKGRRWGKCGVPVRHLFIETSLGEVLHEVGSETFPWMQDDGLENFELTKTRALLQDIALRVKSGEVWSDAPSICPTLVDHPQLRCSNGEIVYELCQSGEIVRTKRWKPPHERRSRFRPLQILKEVYPGSYPIVVPHLALDADNNNHYFRREHNLRLQALRFTTKRDKNCRFYERTTASREKGLDWQRGRQFQEYDHFRRYSADIDTSQW
jgi:hypothetical protein